MPLTAIKMRVKNLFNEIDATPQRRRTDELNRQNYGHFAKKLNQKSHIFNYKIIKPPVGTFFETGIDWIPICVMENTRNVLEGFAILIMWQQLNIVSLFTFTKTSIVDLNNTYLEIAQNSENIPQKDLYNFTRTFYRNIFLSL